MKSPVFKFIVFMVFAGIFATVIFFVFFAVLTLSGSRSEVVQHSFPSPDNTLIASVISDDCGATCSCKIRVDLQAGDQQFKEVFRDLDACDADVTWIDDNRFEVRSDSGKHVVIDVDTLGIAK